MKTPQEINARILYLKNRSLNLIFHACHQDVRLCERVKLINQSDQLKEEIKFLEWVLDSDNSEHTTQYSISQQRNLLTGFVDWYNKERSQYEIPEQSDIIEYLNQPKLNSLNVY